MHIDAPWEEPVLDSILGTPWYRLHPLNSKTGPKGADTEGDGGYRDIQRDRVKTAAQLNTDPQNISRRILQDINIL